MQILSNLSLYGTLGLNSVADANTDTDKFLVIDSNGIVKYRTGQELYNDIGAGGAAAYTSTLQHEVKAGVDLTKGQAVYVTSADGTNMIVSKASNASEATSSKTLGLIAQNLNINGKGYVITEGLLSGLNTMAAGTEGDPVWLGTDGNLIYGLGAKPYAPDHLVFIGIVTRKNANNGEIFVKIQNGFELQELHNVQITSTPSDNTVLAYETSTSLYKMKSISTLLGYTPTTNARTLTINGTSYDLSADRSWSVGTHTGNLTTGYVPKATGATTLTDSLIYDNGSAIGINTNSPYESSAFKLDVNGGVIIKNTNGTTAQLILINSNPATGGNNGFVQLSAGGNTATAFGQWQTYYGMSVASGALRLQPAGGQVLIGTTTTSAFTTDINGTLRVSGQLTLGSTISNNTYVYTMPGASGTLALVSQIPSLSGYVQTSRTLTINGVSYDLSADRSWSIATGVSSIASGTGISVSTVSGVATITNTGLLSAASGTGISVSTLNQQITVTNTGLLSAASGTGISVSTANQQITVTNLGLLSAASGNGISVSTANQQITITNTGILSLISGTGISISTVNGAATITNTITNNNQLTNGAGYITSSALTGYATQSYVNTAISNLVDSAPGTLDTLNELAAALGDDPNFATTIAASIGGKQAQLNGTGFVKASGTTITYDNSTYYLASNPSGYITGITSGMVTTALGYTPYNSSNPSGYVTSSNWAILGGGVSYNIDRTTKVSSGLAIYSAYTGGANSPTLYDISAQYVISGRAMEIAASWHSPSAVMYFRTLRDCCDNWSAWVTMLSSANYNDYAPTKTGGGASGSWGISVTGSAGSLSNMNISQFTNNSGYITGYTETDTLNSVTGRGATTSNTIQIGKLGIGRAAGSNESISVENPEGTWLIQGFRSGSSIGGLHTNDGVLHVQAANVRIQASSTATWNGDTLATRPWVTSQGYLTGITSSQVTTALGYTPVQPNGTGATGTWSINISGTAQYFANNYIGQTDANTIWRAGSYTFFNGVNVPGGDFGLISFPTWSSTDSNSRYNIQLGANIGGNLRYRSTNINGAASWSTMLSDANYNSYSPTLTGGGASGTWGISISGNASTATTATNSSQLNGISSTQIFNNMGLAHGTYTDFNSVGDFGVRYIQGNTNGPGTGAGQFYGFTLGLGSQYDFASYAMQIAMPRYGYNSSSDRYLSIRNKDAGTWTSWSKIFAGYADTAGSLSSMNISQFTNNSGYITGYTETDTLASVTARGASTATTLTITRTDITNIYVGNAIYFGGGNNYLNWDGARINSNVGIQSTSDMRSPIFRFNNSGNNAYFTGDAGWGARIQTDSGYILFGPANGSYAHIYTDRGQFYFNKDILINNVQVVVNSGTWSINVTGSAGSAGSVTGLTLNSSASAINPNNVTQNQIGYNTSVNLFGQTDGGLYSSAYSSDWIHQIYGDFRSGQIAIRGKQSGTWQSWRTVLDSSNYTSYALPLSGGELSGPLYVGATGSGVYTTHWKDGGGSYQEAVGNSTATRKLRLQSFNGSSSYAQWFMDGGNMQIYGTVAGNTNLLIDTSAIYLRWSGADKFWTGSDGVRVQGWQYFQTTAQGVHYPGTNAHFYNTGQYWHMNGTEGSSYGGLVLYSNYNSTLGGSGSRKGYLYFDANGFGLLGGGDGAWAINIHPSNSKRVVIGGDSSLNAYSSTTGVRLMFGGGNDDASNNYYIGTNIDNYNGSYNKLDLRWHTGIRMGAQPGYGGIRFFSTEALSTRIMSIGETDSNIRIDNNLWIGGAGGWITDLFNAKQNASTAINTSNIGSQSVSYANSAGSASVASRAYYSIDGFTNTGGHGSSYIQNELPAANNGAATGRVVLRQWCSEPNVTWDWAGFGYNVTNDGGSPSGFGRFNTNFGQAYMRFAPDGNWYFYNTNTSGTRSQTMQLTPSANAIFGGKIQNGSVWINNGSDNNSYNENIRLFNAPNGVSVIAFSASGESGTPTTSILGYSDRMEFRYGNGEQFRIWNGYVTVAGSLTAASSVTGNDVYTSGGWFRNHTSNNGIYWSNTGWHLYPENGSDFYVRSGNSDASIHFMGGGTTRNYIHNSAANEIGFLNTGRNWTLRVENGGRMQAYGPISRSAHSTGFLEGSYNNVGGNSANTNPIYTIGSSYNPTDSSLSNMYGIGYAHPNLWGSGKTPSWGLYVCEAGTINATIGGGSVTIWAQNDIVAYSDIRVKDNIEVVTNAIEKIQAIRGVTFTRKDANDKDRNKRHAGVIAQEVLNVLPEVVTGTDEDMYSVAYGNMAALFIEAIKEQQKQIEDLKSELNGLTK